MKIDRQEVERIATLAHLEFDHDGLDRMAIELSKILEYIDQLNEVVVSASSVAQPLSTPLREDEVQPSISIDAVQGNAPAFQHGFFVVPKVIGGE